MASLPENPNKPSWLDHYEITHWSWACCYQAERYLKIAAENQRTFTEFMNLDRTPAKYEEMQLNRAKEALAAYDFVSALGVLLRILPRANVLFPEMKKVIRSASHITQEGKALRDMLEHAHDNKGYLRGGGRYPEEFIRVDPDDNIAADATSTVITNRGHILGNRLCVEEAYAELLKIHQCAQTLPQPNDDDDDDD